jgi:8-oxo-dGTP pyrophosphatase MutT (NUDIX family)
VTEAFDGDAGRDAEVVRAAGGVVIGGDGRLGVVHRPRYDDWSLPKGKLFAGEDPLDGALREVEEETGFRCVAGVFLDRISYPDRHGRPKVVDYWLLEPVAGSFVANDEVDELRRMEHADAESVLTYERDRELARKGVEAWRASHT